MTAPRKICVVTGTRAEYGLLYWLMREIDEDPSLELQLIVTGAHLETRFGMTVDVIESDGFRIDARVPIDLADDSPTGIGHAAGRALSGIGAALGALAPDIVVLLGDRYEILAAAFAAMLHQVPIAHIHGGEVTEGAIDDAMRHAITKLAALHFPAAAAYRARIVQMGEDPAFVFNVGAPGLDHLERTSLLSAAETSAALNIPETAAYFVITVHPATLGDADPAAEIAALLDALGHFDDHMAVFTGVNADRDRDVIARRIEEYVDANPDRARLFPSLGQRRYLSAMKRAACVVGNSSSGIIEAPALGVPTVNIGPRQDGRLRAGSVIDCAAEPAAVKAALAQALDPGFRHSASSCETPYGAPGASVRIADVLRRTDPRTLRRKSFHDMPGLRAAS